MLLGMTGTREPLTAPQLDWLRVVMAQKPQLHHGACINADEEAHDAAVTAGGVIVVHPPTNESLMMPKWKWTVRDAIYVMPAKPYWDRNHDIVHDTDRLIALPNGPERKTGGTWGTVRFALANGKGVTICYPDGRVQDRLPSLTNGWKPEVQTYKYWFCRGCGEPNDLERYACHNCEN